MQQVDVAIVGAGILGLAHAYHAARAGLRVAVFERNAQASGASIRNFGMLAIAAQAPGAELASARRSLQYWQEVAPQAGIHLHQAGCLFLARAPEEMAVLEESVAGTAHNGHRLELIPQAGLHDKAPGLRSDLALGGVWSPDAWKVDQRSAPSKIAHWLARSHDVSFHFSTEVLALGSGMIETSAGGITTDHTIICGGDEFAALCPDAFRLSGVSRCQLQMLRTAPQPGGWKLDPFVMGGLSMTRYNMFEQSPSLPALHAYQQAHFAAHLAHGVHVIACQEPDGSITIGDSHAYANDAETPPEQKVDDLILNELSQFLTLPDPQIQERWVGHYAYLPSKETLILAPADKVTAVTVTNGQGMTHSFALAEDVIGRLAA